MTRRRLAEVPPHNVEFEESVLAASLSYADQVIPAVLEEGVQPATFYREAHARLWQAVVAMHGSGAPVNPVTVAHRVSTIDPKLTPMIDALGTVVAGIGHVRYYASELVTLADWRVTGAAGWELWEAMNSRDEARRNVAWGRLVELHRARSVRLGRPALREVAGPARAAGSA